MKSIISIGKYKLVFCKKQVAKIEFVPFIEYGIEYYSIYLNGKKIKEIIAWDKQKTIKELSREYELI